MNKVQALCKILLALAGLSLLLIFCLALLGHSDEAVWFVWLFFIFLLTGIQGFPHLKSFSFTAWVIAAVVISMIYPGYITEVGGYKTDGFIVPLIQLIMFGMGTTMGLKDFAQVVKMPKGIIIGMCCQFTIMPLLAVSLTLLLNFPSEIA